MSKFPLQDCTYNNEDTLLQSDSDEPEPTYFTNDDVLHDEINNNTTDATNNTTASPSASVSASQDLHRQLDSNAPEYVPPQYIEPTVWVGRSFNQQDHVDYIVALRQVNLLVLEGEKYPIGMQKYYFFIALRTPLTHTGVWMNMIHHINMNIKQDLLPSEREEDINAVITAYCESLYNGDPVIENQPLRRAMLNFVSGKYLGRTIQVHYMN